jgi:hypothetical protein
LILKGGQNILQVIAGATTRTWARWELAPIQHRTRYCTVTFTVPVTAVPVFAVAVTATVLVLVVATPVTNPVEFTVTFVVSPLAHVTRFVMSSVELSVSVPVALSCCVPPVVIVGLFGVTAIEFSVALVTVMAAVCVIPPEDTVIVAVPTPLPALFAVTSPEVLTVAIVLSELLHVAVLLTSELVPPTVVAVAVNCCVSFTFMKRFVGESVSVSISFFDGKNESQLPSKIAITKTGKNSRVSFIGDLADAKILPAAFTGKPSTNTFDSLLATDCCPSH